ncbi:hypothetical protein [Cohnella cellulosilytica]|uniref:Sulfotransferase family protein n=1 Tax=Cohnella cellulosilytica TaxID=986710 RepID=A0ABW2FDJ7_9BACL
MKNVLPGRPPLLFFIHIPKTAGSSIHQILHRAYGARLGIYYDRSPAEWEMTLARPDHGLDCVFGHYWFGLHAHSARPYEYATMMRHPVEAILSYYFYIARQPSHWLHPYALQLSMKDFFQLPGGILDPFFRNYQSVYLLGRAPASWEATLRIINGHYPIIGVSELYHESVYLLKDRYGWASAEVFRVNATPNRPTLDQIDPEVIRLITGLVGHDLQLYRFIRKRLEKTIERLPRWKMKQLERFKKEDRLD